MKPHSMIALLRHAKAQKNLENRHGGHGSPLLPQGYQELDGLVGDFTSKGISFDKIICTSKLQCDQTASYLSKVLNIPYEVSHNLVPIKLGLIDGLSNEEVVYHYPDIARKMQEWRNGECEICELNIPGMSDPVEYFNAMRLALDEIKSLKCSVLIIGTRSVLVALSNILLDRHPYPGGGYREVSWHNCGTAFFSIFDNSVQYLEYYSTVNTNSP